VRLLRRRRPPARRPLSRGYILPCSWAAQTWRLRCWTPASRRAAAPPPTFCSQRAPTSRFAWLLAILIAAALAGDLVLLPALLVGRSGRFFRTLAPVDADPASDG
jgi:hypothetical protein